MPEKYSLFPLGYDEISLVDEGAAGSADVLIAKRKSPPKKKLVPARGVGSATSKPPKKKKNKGRTQENPCSSGSNSTGAKDGKSQRSQNWQETKHPRQPAGGGGGGGGKSGGGQFAPTSSESKSKYGKGGTTKSKLDAKCKRKKKKKDSPKDKAWQPAKPNRTKQNGSFTGRNPQQGRGRVKKSSLGSWNEDDKVLAFMERK